MTESISVLIADDHNLFRAGLKELLNKKSEYFVVGEASRGDELIEKYNKLKPDLVISDLRMPQVDGLSALIQLKDVFPSMKSIIVSMEYNKSTLYKVWKAGINGMLGKDCDEGELFLALNYIRENRIYFSGIRDEEDLQKIANNIKTKDLGEFDFNTSLTKKEIEILYLIEKGWASEQIADEMCIGKRTVDFYRSKLIQKLNLRNSNELIAYAVKYFIYQKNRDF